MKVTHLLLIVNTRHTLENGAVPKNMVCYIIEFHGFNSMISVLGLSTLVPAINSIVYRWYGSFLHWLLIKP